MISPVETSTPIRGDAVGSAAVQTLSTIHSTSVAPSVSRFSSGVECKLSAGVGGGSPMRRGQGMAVVVSFGLQQGSRTQAWCYDAAAVSSGRGLTDGPSSGSVSLTIAGLGFGSFGYSSTVVVGVGYGSGGFVSVWYFVSVHSLDI